MYSIIKTALGSKDVAVISRPLANPSQLTSFVYQDTVAVYGIMRLDSKDLQLSIFSPIAHRIVGIKPVSGALAGVAHMRKAHAQRATMVTRSTEITLRNDDGVVKSGEWTPSGGKINLRALKANKISTSTQLSAVFDVANQRTWVLYQNTSNELVILETYRNKTYEIDDANTVPAKTSLKLDIVPNAADSSNSVIVA
ncbi:hypothetical protein S7711_11111 [Stachybotrys chartarum IBT 7711]|uniref:Uncharacterized protein n=1 Tax=Stachybotrys chartarum (strain CBS 109288 / IBT 7711) TaxID=1280523 RepID=A0A084ASL6_STACB|nr:hypothetical protein S7711_11111 [Stachybotrys chartarum IBT 7711]KFA54666.1 hypothetical protein S40293_10591 [Stachybotrys chartarum IBT 40293]